MEELGSNKMHANKLARIKKGVEFIMFVIF